MRPGLGTALEDRPIPVADMAAEIADSSIVGMEYVVLCVGSESARGGEEITEDY
jgi:hypothetical protein